MAAHLFEQLVSIPELVSRDSFSIEVLMIQEEEVRCYDGRGSWRTREWTRRDRRLLDVVERRIFAQPADFLGFVPEQLKRPFTNRELAESTAYAPRLAEKLTYCLKKMGALEVARQARQGAAVRRGGLS